jgi:hypothetical protein
MFPEADWSPVFPGDPPAHWFAIASTGNAVVIISDLNLDSWDRAWLASWLSAYALPRPELEASYVYMGLAATWSATAPDGSTCIQGVIGFGSGDGFGEPAGAVQSTVAEIILLAIDQLLTPS